MISGMHLTLYGSEKTVDELREFMRDVLRLPSFDAGGGWLIGVDPSNLGRGLAQAGAEWRCPWAFWHGRLQPIAGIDLQWKEENRWHTDLSLRGGISFENVSILGRNLQVLAEY